MFASDQEESYNYFSNIYRSIGFGFPLTLTFTDPDYTATMLGSWATDSQVSINLQASVPGLSPSTIITLTVGSQVVKWSYPSASDRGRQLKICAATNGVQQGYPLYAGEPLRKLPNGYNDNLNLVARTCNTTYAPVIRGSKNLIPVYIPVSSHATKDFFMKAPPLYQTPGVDSVKVGTWVASRSVSFPYVERHHGNPDVGHKFAYRGRLGLPGIYGNWVVAKINRATLFNIKSYHQINARYW